MGVSIDFPGPRIGRYTNDPSDSVRGERTPVGNLAGFRALVQCAALQATHPVGKVSANRIGTATRKEPQVLPKIDVLRTTGDESAHESRQRRYGQSHRTARESGSGGGQHVEKGHVHILGLPERTEVRH